MSGSERGFFGVFGAIFFAPGFPSFVAVVDDLGGIVDAVDAVLSVLYSFLAVVGGAHNWAEDAGATWGAE